jgi:serine/threonine-protein kinase
VKGKLGYMSPEQVVGQDVDPRSDLFSVGIILAELLLLRPLFSGKNELEILTRTHEADISVLERHAGGIPREIMALLRRALARRRLDRFQSADEFLEALRQVAHVLGIDLNEADLVPWLSRFNLLSNRSGTHEATRPNAAQLASAPKPAEPLPGASLRRPPPPRRPTPPALRAPPTKLPEQRVRRFELRMRDGSTLGPFSLGNLVELFVTGRAPKNALVSEDGQAPVPATEIPILSGIARRRTFSFGLRFDDKRQKELRRPELPALFYTLVLRRETGLLVVRDGSREKKVYFEEGVPVLVASTLASELLGAWLRARGLITESDVERALLRACETDTALGEAFVGLGLLGPAALESELMAQMEARLFELFEWRSGRLWYVRGERSDASARNPAKLPLALVTKAIRHAFSEAELTTMTAGYDEAPLDVVTRAVPSALGLTSVEYRVVELIAQGERPLAAVRALVSRSEASVAEARRGLYVALCSGLVRPKASR